MIEFKNVNKKFGHIQVLNNVSLSIDKGVCAVLIGPNGCGKTTLLKSMLNMVIPDSGYIAVNNIEVKQNYESRKDLGFMPQIGYFPDNMTVKEIVSTIKSIREEDRELDYDLYEEFEIKSFENKKANTLSGGMIQKVSASIAFLFNPEIIVMDEPFAGLDILAADILKKKIIKEKQKGKTILITSHTFSEIDEVISHVIFMDGGSVLFYKPLEELLMTTGKNSVTEAIISILK